MVNGIPVKVATQDADGEYTQVETVCFATIRKCPELAGALKAIIRADKAETVAARRAQLAERAILECEKDAELEALEEAAVKAVEAAEAATQAMFDSVRGFVLAGLKGAGYTETQAERYADYLPFDRLAELKAAAMIGSGRLDFTQARAGMN
jgi:hypothetical protein